VLEGKAGGANPSRVDGNFQGGEPIGEQHPEREIRSQIHRILSLSDKKTQKRKNAETHKPAFL